MALYFHYLYLFKKIQKLPVRFFDNNPTGEVRDYQRMKEWIGAHPDKLFVIDLSYESFTFKRLFSVSEVAALPNVILIHSLTKHFAIPGLRMGYLTGNAKLMKEIRLQRMPWSVNSLAIEAGFFALEKNLELSINLREYLDTKEKFVKELKRTGIVDVWDSDTHFFLVKLRMGKASALKEYLAEEHGILIRNASNFEGLDESFFRLATQTEEAAEPLTPMVHRLHLPHHLRPKMAGQCVVQTVVGTQIGSIHQRSEPMQWS